MSKEVVALTVAVSCACRVCGEVYNILCAHGAVPDDGACHNCHVADSVAYQGLISEQVVEDFESREWEQGWDKQAEEAAYRKRLQDAGRYPPPRIEDRTCPVCFQDFTVELHMGGGRTKHYCSDKCRKLRWWHAH